MLYMHTYTTTFVISIHLIRHLEKEINRNALFNFIVSSNTTLMIPHTHTLTYTTLRTLLADHAGRNQ